MSFQDFIEKNNGKYIDFDGWYGAQCVDEMNQYLADVLGITNPIQTFPGATAYEIYQNANDSRFDKIANTPTGVPSEGDIIFWNTGVGSAGHVAIFIDGTANSFTSFDQNWPVGSPCHTQGHTYANVAGWLHFKANTPSDSQTIILGQSDAFIAICTKLNLPANRDIVLGEIEKLLTYEDQIVQKDKQLSEDQIKIKDLGDQVTAGQTSIEQFKTELKALTDKADKLSEDNQILSKQVEDLKAGANQVTLTGWKLFIYKLLLNG
jgi:uncharacterized coiled-coil protein SlyX